MTMNSIVAQLQQHTITVLVENHPDTLNALRRYLERVGHVVETAETLAGTLSGLSAKPCDVLIADLGLPDGDGWSLPALLGAALPSIAVAMSGRNSPEDRARSKAAGFHAHIVKPFLPEELDRVLSALGAGPSS